MADKLKLIIVDDSKIALAQLESIIGEIEGANIVGSAADGLAAIRSVATLRHRAVSPMATSSPRRRLAGPPTWT